MKSSFSITACITVLTLIATTAAQDTEDKAIEQARVKRIRELAESYVVHVDGEKTSAKLQPDPIFRWTNPERGSKGGTLFLWTDQGRPVMTLGVWTYRDIRLSRELQSLCLKPFTAKSPDGVNLTPTVAGVEFQQFPNSPQPSETAVARLIQMRRIASDFSAKMKRDNDSRTEPLRLLSQPLYRYVETPQGIKDGALFAFSTGTDPEVFLLLEARDAAWHYAFASATSRVAEAFHKDATVWKNRPRLSGTFFIDFHPNE